MPLLASAQLFTWEGVPGQPTTKLFTLQSDWSGTVTVTAYYSDGGQKVPDRLQPSFTKTGLTISALFSGTATSGLPNKTFVAIATGNVVRIRGNLVLKPLADQVFAVGQASATTPGYLSAQDWNTFNNKQNALGFTPLNPANNLSELIANAMAVRANLNIKSMASQENFQVAITGGNINNLSTLTGASGVFSTYLQAGGVRLTPINNNSQNLVLGYDQSAGKTFINSWNGKPLNLNPSGGQPVNVGAALNVTGPISTSGDITSTIGTITAPYLYIPEYTNVGGGFYSSGPALFDNVTTFSNTVTVNSNLIVTGPITTTNTINGVAASKFPYLDVTSSIQGQLNSKGDAFQSGNNVFTGDNEFDGTTSFFGPAAISGGATFDGTTNFNTGTTTFNNNVVHTAPVSMSNGLTVNQLKLSSVNTAPSSSTAAGSPGEIRFAAGALYFCIATNTWVRAVFSPF